MRKHICWISKVQSIALVFCFTFALVQQLSAESSNDGQYKYSFNATVSRVIFPKDQKIVGQIDVGTEFKGEVHFSETPRLFHATNPGFYYQNAITKIFFSDPINATFEGMWITYNSEVETIALAYTPFKCGRESLLCSASGPGLDAVTVSGEEFSYTPLGYHVTRQDVSEEPADFADLLNIFTAADGDIRSLVSFSFLDKRSGEIRLILALDDFLAIDG